MRILFALVSVVGFSVAPAIAGDGQVSDASLARMGLSGMNVISDADGLSVRGQSIAVAGSFTHVSGPSVNLVNIPFSVGAHSAFSAKVTIGIGVIAGGFSTASAH